MRQGSNTALEIAFAFVGMQAVLVCIGDESTAAFNLRQAMHKHDPFQDPFQHGFTHNFPADTVVLLLKTNGY